MDTNNPHWREGWLLFARDLRARWLEMEAAHPAAVPDGAPTFAESQARVDAALESLCRETSIDPVWLVDRLCGTPEDPGLADDHLGTHKLIGALVPVVSAVDPSLVARADALRPKAG